MRSKQLRPLAGAILGIWVLLAQPGLVSAAATVEARGAMTTGRAMGNLVLDTNREFGYQMLRPDRWAPIDLGYGIGAYQSPAGAARPQLLLWAINLRRAEQALIPNTTILEWEAFNLTGVLPAWTDAVERSWAHNGSTFSRIASAPEARIFYTTQGTGITALRAFVIDNGDPLLVGLSGTTAYPTLEAPKQLRADGLLANFKAIVGSVHSVSEASRTATAARDPVVSTPTLRQRTTPSNGRPETIDLGPFYGDSGYRTVDQFTYRLKDVYYQAPPQVANLYEYMNYSNYQTWTATLFRTNVTDNVSNTCVYGGGLLEHPINKSTTPSSGTVTDSYWPYKYVAHLNSTTAYLMVFGIAGAVAYCKHYFPYTQH